jgi:hypothetical protein
VSVVSVPITLPEMEARRKGLDEFCYCSTQANETEDGLRSVESIGNVQWPGWASRKARMVGLINLHAGHSDTQPLRSKKSILQVNLPYHVQLLTQFLQHRED